MKNVYEVLEISIVTLGEDIITTSTPTNFDSKEHEFGNPNNSNTNSAIFGE